MATRMATIVSNQFFRRDSIHASKLIPAGSRRHSTICLSRAVSVFLGAGNEALVNRIHMLGEVRLRARES